MDLGAFRQMVAKNPKGFLGQYGLGNKLLQEGGSLEEAVSGAGQEGRLLLLVIPLQGVLSFLQGLLDPLRPFTRRLADALADIVAHSLDRLHHLREGLGHALGPEAGLGKQDD